jgi:hypothetical protein
VGREREGKRSVRSYMFGMRGLVHLRNQRLGDQMLTITCYTVEGRKMLDLKYVIFAA